MSALDAAAPRIALVTCAAYAELDVDDQLLIQPLRDLGAEVTIATWDDPAVAWGQFDAAVIRSTWDYTQHRPEFLQWAAAVSAVSRLLNPLPVITWSSDKIYLPDLAAADVPVVPTQFVKPGQSWTLPNGQFVVKPSISAGSRDTLRLSDSAAGNLAVQALHKHGRVAMIQPYLTDVDVHAETALVFLGGAFSHAVSKAALLPLDAPAPVLERGLFLAEKIAERTPRADQLAVAEAALQCAPSGWLYARVDLIDDEQGRPVVLELEMVEPSLFLGSHAGDRPAQTLAALIVDAV